MKKLTLLFLFLSICSVAEAGAPSRANTYEAGTTILSADVTANEDAIFNYLQGGVDTYKDGSIVNADISASAAIDDAKLDLTTVSQNITHSGTLTLSGSLNVTGTVTDLGTVSTTGAITTGGKITAGANEIEGSNFDINGGFIDDVTMDDITVTDLNIEGANTDGQMFANDGNNEVELIAAGTSSQVLFGGTPPSFGSPAMLRLSTTTQTATTNSGDITITTGSPHLIVLEIEDVVGDSQDSNITLRFNSDSGANYNDAGTGGQTDITITDVNNGGLMTGYFYITFLYGDDTQTQIFGESVEPDATSGNLVNTEYFGRYNGASNVSNFEIVSDQNINMVIYTYALGAS